MKCSSRSILCRAALALSLAATLAFDSANAVDLRSWDQKIDNASQRFVLLGAFNNEAVLDKETQLVWERTPTTSTYGWYYADVQRCGMTPIGGRYGWRLPSRYELMTLLDASVASGVKLAPGHPFVGVSSSARYWSSSLNPQKPGDRVALSVNGSTPATYDPNTTSSVRVWCVRGAAASDGY
ncbi:MAG TPA: DUF1566 domain-containing protein [Steroidobacteraceae bacterium]|nr:DUF1566 domain-containing protein [Steroidobacteraceae bacterium]